MAAVLQGTRDSAALMGHKDLKDAKASRVWWVLKVKLVLWVCRAVLGQQDRRDLRDHQDLADFLGLLVDLELTEPTESRDPWETTAPKAPPEHQGLLESPEPPVIRGQMVHRDPQGRRV